MDIECHDDCNVVSKRTAAKETFHAMTISIVLSFYHVLPHIVMSFLTFCVRSVCAFMRVCLCRHMSQGGMTCIVILSCVILGLNPEMPVFYTFNNDNM